MNFIVKFVGIVPIPGGQEIIVTGAILNNKCGPVTINRDRYAFHLSEPERLIAFRREFLGLPVQEFGWQGWKVEIDSYNILTRLTSLANKYVCNLEDTKIFIVNSGDIHKDDASRERRFAFDQACNFPR